jgi:hypothetical protein
MLALALAFTAAPITKGSRMAKPKAKLEVIEGTAELEDFLRGVEGKGAVRIDARHLIAGKDQADPVCSFDIGEADLDSGEIARFNGDDINNKLLQDANSYGGIQRYRLYAFQENKKSPCDSFGIKLDGLEDIDASSSEQMGNPLQACLALLTQSHRHNEALMRGFKDVAQAFVTSGNKDREVLAQALKEAHEEKAEVYSLLKEIHTVDREKTLMLESAKRQAKKDDVMVGLAKLLGPAIIAKFSGSETVKEEAVSQLLQSFTSEQMAQIFPLLTDEQRMALGAIADKKAKEEKEEEDKGKKGEGNG